MFVGVPQEVAKFKSQLFRLKDFLNVSISSFQLWVVSISTTLSSAERTVSR